jgi:small conductance mechanosensitive channel
MDPKLLIEDFAIRYGLNVLGAVIIMVVGVLAARWVGKAADQRLRTKKMEPPLRILLVRVLRIVVIAAAGVAALDKLGVQITPLVAGIGVAGVGIGFAFQGVLSNLIAGLTIIVTKPFRVGEYIKVTGVEGEVFHIDLPTTVLLHADRSRVIVPNRKIVGEILHNFGVIRQVNVVVTVASPGDVTTALEAVNAVLARTSRALKDPAPVVGVSGMGEGAIRITVAPWVAGADFGSVEPELYLAIIEDFRARGIDMGVRRELRLVNGATKAPEARPS